MSQTSTLPTLQELLEAGVHFGHRRERSHPKTRQYTFTIRDGVFIIDLEQTAKLLQSAIDYLKKQLDDQKIVLFVGTKRQYQDLVAKTAQTLGMPYVTNKWLGGTLTNFDQLRKTAKKLGELESLLSPSSPSAPSGPSSPSLTKKERLLIEQHIQELHERYDGLKHVTRLPDLLFVIDPRYEETAVKEAKLLEIPVVAILDTASNPDQVDVVIPANDDSRKSIELILNAIVDGVTRNGTEKQKNLAAEKHKGIKITAPKDQKTEKQTEEKPKPASYQQAKGLAGGPARNASGSDAGGNKKPKKPEAKAAKAKTTTKAKKTSKRK